MIEALLQGALVVRETGSTAPKAQLLAHIVVSIQALLTIITRYAYFDSDFITNLYTILLLGFGSNSDDETRTFVSRAQGLFDAEVTVPIVSEVVKVRATESCSPHSNLYFIVSRCLNCSGNLGSCQLLSRWMLATWQTLIFGLADILV